MPIRLIIACLSLITMISACTPRLAPQPIHTVNPVPNPTLTKQHTHPLIGNWHYHSQQGFTFNPYPKTTLGFDDKGYGVANAGCNNIGFSYQADHQNLIINNLISTKMACDNGFESELNQFLQSSLQFNQDKHTLILSNTDGKRLILTQNAH